MITVLVVQIHSYPMAILWLDIKAIILHLLDLKDVHLELFGGGKGWEVLLLILNYVWNTSFNVRHNSRLGVLQD